MEHPTAEKPLMPTIWNTFYPKPLRVLYICKEQELHEATIWLWFNRVVRRSDRPIAHLPSLVGMLYGFDSQAAYHPEEKPTVH